MRTEDQASQHNRYLFAEEYLTDNAINIWKEQTSIRCKNIEKGPEYQNYMSWERRYNEILVFTLYAYADFTIPKEFDIIFELENPENYVQVVYELTQSIYEGWLPTDAIDDGHKHFTVFRFKESLPKILDLLHSGDQKFSTSPPGQTRLGFCNSKDFDAIKQRLEQIVALKKQYGKTWYEHDD
ncbi:MAG: hypothetical protein V4581_05815 [Bacteroidota bacterium]